MSFLQKRQSLHYDCCGRVNVHFISRKAIVIGNGRVETANFSGMLCFQNMRNLHVLGQFLSDFVRIKSNVSPTPSTFTYPIFEKSNFWPNYPFKEFILGVLDISESLSETFFAYNGCLHAILDSAIWTFEFFDFELDANLNWIFFHSCLLTSSELYLALRICLNSTPAISRTIVWILK